MRTRWFIAQFPLPVHAIAQRLKDNNFTSQKDNGFIVDRIREKSVEGRYVEKFTYQEKILDPFGNEILFDRINYQTVEFVLFDDFPNIEIVNSPRSINSYTSRLLEICNFDLTINNIDIDLIKWVANFQTKIGEKVLVDCIQINDLEIDFGIKAKILVKGDKDVTESLNTFIAGRKYKVEKIQLRLPFRDNSISINLSNNASVKIPDIALIDIMPLIRGSLPNPGN